MTKDELRSALKILQNASDSAGKISATLDARIVSIRTALAFPVGTKVRVTCKCGACEALYRDHGVVTIERYEEDSGQYKISWVMADGRPNHTFIEEDKVEAIEETDETQEAAD